MTLDVYPVGSEQEAARVAADVVCRIADEAIAARGQFQLALSGGRGPELLFRELVSRPVRWERVALYQVDERVAPSGHEDRNVELIRRCFAPVLDRLAALHPMPVDDDDVDAAAHRYGDLLRQAAGRPPVFDLVHLGIGPDGHTASLVPGRPELDITDRSVAVTAEYQGWRRMTVTFPVLDAARHRLWYVTDPDKRVAVERLLRRDPAIPAGRVRPDDTTAVILADALPAADGGS